MNLSLRQLIAPWVGAVLAWCAAHGLALDAHQTLIVTGIACGLFANGVHWLEAHLERPVARVKAPDSAAVRTLPKVLLLPVLLALAGVQSSCAGAPVRSTDEGLYAAYGTYVAVEEALAEDLASHAISRAQGAVLQSRALKARALLDAAKAAESAAPATASSDLAAALSALAALQAIVNAPGVTHP